MKTTFKFILALVMVLGFTTNGFSQRKPVIGTVVYQLPRNAKKIVLNKSHYIKHNNVLYTKVRIRGKRAYKVVRYY